MGVSHVIINVLVANHSSLINLEMFHILQHDSFSLTRAASDKILHVLPFEASKVAIIHADGTLALYQLPKA